ncbi:hypothetical protein D3C80_1604690 [compost metagenome]
MSTLMPERFYTHRTLGKMSLFIMTKYDGKNADKIDAMILNLCPQYSGNIKDGYKLPDRSLFLHTGDYLTFSYATGFQVFSEKEIERNFNKEPLLTKRAFWWVAALVTVLAIGCAVVWQMHDYGIGCPTPVDTGQQVGSIFK